MHVPAFRYHEAVQARAREARERFVWDVQTNMRSPASSPACVFAMSTPRGRMPHLRPPKLCSALSSLMIVGPCRVVVAAMLPPCPVLSYRVACFAIFISSVESEEVVVRNLQLIRRPAGRGRRAPVPMPMEVAAGSHSLPGRGRSRYGAWCNRGGG